MIVFYYARESCVLGCRKSLVRKQVAIFFFPNRELVCSKAGCQPKQKRHNRTGRNTTKLRKQVAIIFFCKTENGCTAKQVVNCKDL